MGKQEEIRCLDVEGWRSRQSFGCAYNYSSDWECLVRLNQLIAEADHLLYGHNEIYPMYYEDQGKKIEEVGCNFTIYLKYVDNLPNDIKAIDHAFYVDIKSNAVQELSEIKQEKYSVQEGALAEKYGGVTLGDYVVGCRVYDYQNLGETTIELTELQEFSEMLQSTFHELAQANDVETEDYILQMLENGEYDHQAYHPGEDFRSGLLDTVTFGVKPMLEMIAGEDFVTGEEMTDTLRKEKSIEVIMGMVAVAGIPLTKIGSQGAKGFVTQLGIEMATGAVGYTIYEAGEAIDLPPGLTMVATLAGGALTYRFLEGRILRVGVAEGVSASALDSLDDGLKSVDDIVERPIKGGSSTVQKVFTDSPFDEAGNLKPNIKYQTGEFKYNYETDANGRISNWNTDNLQLTERDARLNYNSDTPGKIEGDHAGHLAGDRFGGSPELDNIVSQSQNINLSQYKKIENQWAKAISEGKEVTVNVDIKYDGDGLRPIEFNVEYTIDGDFFSQSILN